MTDPPLRSAGGPGVPVESSHVRAGSFGAVRVGRSPVRVGRSSDCVGLPPVPSPIAADRTRPDRIALYGASVSVQGSDVVDVVEVSLGVPAEVVVRRVLIEVDAGSRSSLDHEVQVLDLTVPSRRRDYLHGVLPVRGVLPRTLSRLRLRIPLRPAEVLVAWLYVGTVRATAGKVGVGLRLVAECDLVEWR